MTVRAPADRARRARRYWLLRDWSPLIMLVGVVASAMLFARGFLFFVDSDSHPLGIDTLIAAAALAVWAWASWFLLRPPPEVLARPKGPFAADRLLVWPHGSLFRLARLLGIPAVGLIGGLAVLTIPLLLQPVPWFALPIAAGASVVAILFLLGVVRTAVYGSVELTHSHLRVCGFLRTRRYGRSEIASVDAKAVGPVFGSVVEISTVQAGSRFHIDTVLCLTFHDGRTVRANAVNSLEIDVEGAVKTIRAWRAGHDPGRRAGRPPR